MPMIIDGTNGGFFPSWTTATRPASPSAGQMGYNTTTGNFDLYTAAGWVSAFTSAGGALTGGLTVPSAGITFSDASTQTSGAYSSANITAQFASSKAGTGYQKLPSGVIFQWGSVGFSGVTSVAVTYPTAFPTSTLVVVVSQSDSASVIMGRLNATTTTGFTALTSSAGFNLNYIAIGY
jgi:hypothetical protein